MEPPMECRQPPPLTEDQLSAALDDTADLATRAHLAACPACTGRLERAGHFERRLSTRMARWDCPDPERLGDYQAGLLDTAAAQALAAHLAHCPPCQTELRALQQFLGIVTAPATDAPQPPARPASLPRREIRLRPRAPAAPAALRGLGQQPIIAQDAGVTVLLELPPDPDGRIMLTGQLVADPDAWQGALVEAIHWDAVLAVALVGEFGDFSCGPLSNTPTSIRISAPDGRSLLVTLAD